MFTGLIEGTGTLQRIDRTGTDALMIIQANFEMGKIVLGESIAVDGACLTVVSFKGSVFAADVSAETLGRTTLGGKTPGSRLNLERAVRVGDRLGGHIVSGHVDGIGVLKDRKQEGRSIRLIFSVPSELSRYIVEKGSIAINGISLTVNGCSDGSFDVNIVPHTARETSINEWQIGTSVNLETDIIGKYVEKMLSGKGTGNGEPRETGRIDESFLRNHGFL
jgi:riboflavin synthase